MRKLLASILVAAATACPGATPPRPPGTQVTPDGTQVLFLRAEPRKAQNALYAFDVATGQVRPLVTAEQILKGAEEKLSPEEKARRERMRLRTGGIPGYQLSRDGARLLLALAGRVYLVALASGEAREV